jgi:hypothetical protein
MLHLGTIAEFRAIAKLFFEPRLLAVCAGAP